jgi:tetratricopeptide (TPR) repeat protein
MAATEPQPTPPAAPSHDHLVEDRRRLSRSVLWRVQRAFYDRRGAAAWTTSTVPWFVTSNACLARAYAQVIDAYLRDVAAGAYGPDAADPSRPVHVVEVGAGHGRFAFLVLEHLAALATARAGAGPRAPLRYVLTDFTETNLTACAEHPALRPHLEAGRLDLARFDAERDGELQLRRTGVTLAADDAGAPMVVIANYLFDSLVTDVFRVKAGALEESLPALYSTRAEPDLEDPALLERVKLVYQHVPAGAAPYGDPALDGILAAYAATLTDTVIALPVGALACLRAFHRLAGGRMLLLSADKGYVHEEELLRRLEPQPVLHGSFSLSVNFHAIGAWFRRVGGEPLEVTPRDGSLTPTAFVAGAPAAALPRTTSAWTDWIESFGPMDFLALHDELRAHEKASLAALLALLRLADHDPWIFYRIVDRMLPQLDDAVDQQRRDARRAVMRVWSRYYHLGGSNDVPFEIARVLQRLRHHGDAITFYRRSLELFGDSHVTHHNVGLCLYYGRHAYAEALVEFERALAMKPDYGPAREWKLRTQAELRGA